MVSLLVLVLELLKQSLNETHGLLFHYSQFLVYLRDRRNDKVDDYVLEICLEELLVHFLFGKVFEIPYGTDQQDFLIILHRGLLNKRNAIAPYLLCKLIDVFVKLALVFRGKEKNDFDDFSFDFEDLISQLNLILLLI